MFLPSTVEEAIKIQKQLAKKVVTVDKFEKLSLVAGVDIHYKDEKVILGYAVVNYPEVKLENKIVKKYKKISTWDYKPEFLCFLEGVYIVQFIKELETKSDILILDGHGIAHPRKMGLASYVGVVCDIPTIGCAKNILYGNYDRDKLAQSCGSCVEIKNEFNETIGYAVRTKDNVKEIFVSVGHKVSLNTAKEIVLTLSKYRIPEPLRIAHQLAKTE